jgi:DNA-binding NtrC family response regulator
MRRVSDYFVQQTRACAAVSSGVFRNCANPEARGTAYALRRSLVPLSPRLLLVEPRDRARDRLAAAASDVATVESCADFQSARARLCESSFDFLVANLRLGAFNGLHLVYLASTGATAPRAIVYTDQRDPGLGALVQRAGAFYEVGGSLVATLSTYVAAALPESDRRDPAAADRRREFRGGRRIVDRSPGPQFALV